MTDSSTRALPDHQHTAVSRTTAAPRADWALPPPITGAWRDLAPAEAAALIVNLGAVAELPESDEPFVIAHALDRVRMRALPCYGERARLLELQGHDGDGTALLVSFILGPWGYTLLDGTSPPLHNLNELHGVTLASDEQVRDYLRLFCRYVRSNEGAFEVIETMDQIDHRLDDADARASIDAQIAPINLGGRDAEGRWLASARLLYGDGLFAAEFAISAAGMVEMQDDDPLLHDLPIAQEAWDPPFRMVPETRPETPETAPDQRTTG
jgi:hypothetical protein